MDVRHSQSCEHVTRHMAPARLSVCHSRQQWAGLGRSRVLLAWRRPHTHRVRSQSQILGLTWQCSKAENDETKADYRQQERAFKAAAFLHSWECSSGRLGAREA